ncbi:MAG: hypothetical protein BWK76_15300 [Desulfobulbaceae bacterium A2]|nr:MAG: hypothetical protein BWK76_15300 [Desulfobulbaceae bacterium A2]
MVTFSAAPGSRLSWVQPFAMERRFTLHAEQGGMVGELHFDTPQTALAVLTTADSGSQRWILQQTGLIKHRVTIREEGTADDAAIFYPKLMGDGWLRLLNGSRLHWKPLNFAGNAWGMHTEHNDLLLSLQANFFDLLKIESTVEIKQQCQCMDELPLLLAMSWYLMVCHRYAGR